MRLTFTGIRNWLEDNATACTEEELHTIAGIVDEALPIVCRKNEEIKLKLAQIVRLAQEAGLDEKAVARLISSKTEAPASQRPSRTGVRRPYMNPFDADSGIHAFPPNHPEKLPTWAKEAMENGWAKEEMHYKHLEAAWAQRGMERLYDPVARHLDLQTAEAAKGGFQRKKKQ